VTVERRRGRPRRYSDEMTIYKRVRANPYPRKGGKRHRIFELYEDGVLVRDFRRRAIATGLAKDGWGYLRSDVRRGHIEVRQAAGL
jgi:hypothetical protein